MKDRIEPYESEDDRYDRYERILGQGEYTPLDGKTFSFWDGYLSRVVDECGFRGTIIYIPNVEKERLFTND